MASFDFKYRAVSASTKEELMLLIAKLEVQMMCKVGIITFYYDPDKKEHVCWYYPPRGNSQIGGL